jgi:hypothetical protein
MRLRIGFCRWFLPLFALSMLAPRARADIGRFLGFQKPLLIGSLGKAASIDIGADGRTDLVIFGYGILNGSEDLDTGCTLLVQQPDGGWARREQLPSMDPIVVDLDQDGREDLVAESDQQLMYWRQTGDGLLEQISADTIPSVFDPGVSKLFPLGGGRVLRLSYEYSVERSPVTALLFEWRGVSQGFHLAWADTLADSDGFLIDPSGIATASGVPYVVSTESSTNRLWAAPITEDGPGSPVFSDPLTDYHMTPVRTSEGGRVLLWSRSEGNVYSDVVPGADSVSLRVDRVAGMPKLVRPYGTPAILSRANGTSTVAFPRVDSLGNCAAFVRIDASLPPHYEGSARFDDPYLEALVDAPGRLEVLASTAYGATIAPSEPRSKGDPDIPFDILKEIAMDDMDGDGIPDILFHGWSPGIGFGIWIARGIDQAPWFASPEEIPVTEEVDGGLSVAVGDLDGDGKRDLLLISSSSSGPELRRLHPYFQGEGDFEAGGVVEIPDVKALSIAGIGEFDGDGRVEVSYQIGLFGGAVRLLRWNRDRSVDSTIGTVADLTGTPVAIGDFDGDGRDELAVSAAGALSIVRLYPREKAYQIFAQSLTPVNPTYCWSGDMNGDGRAELYVERNTGTLYSFSPDGAAHTLRENIMRRYSTSNVSLIDVDEDGFAEMIATSDIDGSIEIIDDVATPGEESSLWVAPDGLGLVSAANLYWRDVDHDGDLDPIFICNDGIRVGRNDASGPVPTRSQDGMLRLVSASPAGKSARIAVRIERPGTIDLGLYDVGGHAIWSERRTSAPANQWIEFTVAPKPADGAIARGIYFLKVVGGGRAATRRILLGF